MVEGDISADIKLEIQKSTFKNDFNRTTRSKDPLNFFEQ
jgi:hypothetical protein